MRLKTPKEIEILAMGGALLSQALDRLCVAVKPGATSREIDTLARQLLKEYGATSSILGYAPSGHAPYPAVSCISTNESVVHGLPNDIPFQSGDIIGIDFTWQYKGLHVDSARTIACGKISSEKQRLLDVTRRALEIGIEQAKPGNHTGDIGAAIQHYVEGEGFGIIRQLVGHGVGYEVHEEPQVPNFGQTGQGPLLKPGLVIAIEPMVTIGDPEITTAADGWSIITTSGRPGAHFEHTVAVTVNGPKILTLERNKVL